MTATVAPTDDPAALTRYIETRYHARHRRDLPELRGLAQRVEAAHAADPEVPQGLAALLHHMIGELEMHMKKEEAILFPLIRAGAPQPLDAPIAAMRADHDDHDDWVARIRTLTNGLVPPDGACGSWRALYQGIGGFLSDLADHVRLENDVLFPRFETAR